MLQQEPIRSRNGFPGKIGKEAIAEAYRRPKWVPHYGAQADSGRAQNAQALLGYAHAQLGLKQLLLTSGD